MKKQRPEVYNAVHHWLRRAFGKADHCDMCGAGKDFQWSSRSHQYTRDPQEYWQLCRKCHDIYDRKILGKTSGNKGITLSEEHKRRISATKLERNKPFKNGMRNCLKCGKKKAAEQFHKDKTKRWGRAVRCKECVNNPSPSEGEGKFCIQPCSDKNCTGDHI